METQNARILNVLFKRNENDCLLVEMSVVCADGGSKWSFIMENLADVKRLKCLMKYADANKLEKLNNKIIRVILKDDQVIGMGDPLENKFFHVRIPQFEEVSLEMFRGYVI